MSQSNRVIVVGAGVSGMAAAYRLQQQGFDVIVLERNSYIGGKAKTIQRDGFLIDEGASILPSKYTHTLALARDIGLSSELQPGGSVVGMARGHDIHYLDSAHMVRDSLTTRLISARSKLTMVRVGLDNRRIAPHLSYEDMSSAAAFDVETAADYARRRANPEIFEYLMDATLRGMCGASGEKTSVIDYFFAFNNVIGSTLLSFKQGMGFLPNAIAQHSGIDVRLNCTALEAQSLPQGARVTWRTPSGEQTEDVAGVVIALAAFQTADLVPSLPSEALQILRGMKYTTSVSVKLGLRAPPPGIPAAVIQVPRSVHPDLFAVVMEHNKAAGRVPAGKGMATLFAMSDWGERLIHEDDDSVVAKMLAAGEKVVPGLASYVEFAHINRWYPVIVYSSPGLYRQLAPLKRLMTQTPHIAYGGDYFSCGCINTAVAGGERAARELTERLKPSTH